MNRSIVAVKKSAKTLAREARALELVPTDQWVRTSDIVEAMRASDPDPSLTLVVVANALRALYLDGLLLRRDALAERVLKPFLLPSGNMSSPSKTTQKVYEYSRKPEGTSGTAPPVV